MECAIGVVAPGQDVARGGTIWRGGVAGGWPRWFAWVAPERPDGPGWRGGATRARRGRTWATWDWGVRDRPLVRRLRRVSRPVRRSLSRERQTKLSMDPARDGGQQESEGLEGRHGGPSYRPGVSP